MKRINLLLLLAVSISITSCTTTNITTQKNFEYNEKIQSLGVASYFSGLFERTTEPFYSGISERLNNMNIDSELFIPTSGVETNEVEFEKTRRIVEEFNESGNLEGTSHILLIYDTRTDFFQSFNPNGGSNKTITTTIVAYLVDKDTSIVVWQADVQVKSGDFGNASQSGRSLSKKIFTELKNSGFL